MDRLRINASPRCDLSQLSGSGTRLPAAPAEDIKSLCARSWNRATDSKGDVGHQTHGPASLARPPDFGVAYRGHIARVSGAKIGKRGRAYAGPVSSRRARSSSGSTRSSPSRSTSTLIRPTSSLRPGSATRTAHGRRRGDRQRHRAVLRELRPGPDHGRGQVPDLPPLAGGDGPAGHDPGPAALMTTSPGPSRGPSAPSGPATGSAGSRSCAPHDR